MENVSCVEVPRHEGIFFSVLHWDFLLLLLLLLLFRENVKSAGISFPFHGGSFPMVKVSSLL